ncbi:MAG: DUF2383 domain-containing protein [Desulfovibrionales bacterium]
MEYNEVLDNLRDLIRLDIDAANAFKIARRSIEDQTVRDKFAGFRKDHEMHIMELSSMVTSIKEEEAPEYSEQFSGFLNDFEMPEQGADFGEMLQAIEKIETQVRNRYKQVVSIHDMPPEFHMVIDRYYKQEGKHLDYIRKILQEHAKAEAT